MTMHFRINGLTAVSVVMASLLAAGCPDSETNEACASGTVQVGGECVVLNDTSDSGSADATSDAGGDDTSTDATNDAAPDTDNPNAVALPFTVDDYYGPSGYFPAEEAENIAAEPACAMRPDGAVGLCHGFTWTPGDTGFAGVWWQNPDGNWGEAPGLSVAAGATSITFWAWGAKGGENVKFVSGYATDGYEINTGDLTLTDTPTQYTLPFGASTYTTIAGGFGWVATPNADSSAVTVFVDGIEMTDAGAATGCTDAAANNYDADATVDDGSCTYDAQPLPLTVDDHYAPSGFFPAEEGENIDADGTCPNRAGDENGDCHAFTWTAGTSAFAGVWWQSPDGNWGDMGVPGLAIAPGATAISFWAWGKVGGEVIEFLSGYSSDPYERKTEITLSTTPTEYRLDLTGTTYDTVAGGFGWVTAAGGVSFYVDDIQMVDTVVMGAGCTDATANNFDATATSDDASCTYDVTFEVDLSCSDAMVTSPVAISGPFCEWCASGFDLNDSDDDKVWTGTFSFPKGALEYKYMANGFDLQEDLIGAGSCAVVTDGVTHANRQITVGGVMTQSDTWGQCIACGEQPQDAIDLPVTFDEANTDYSVTDFGGTATTLVADPADSGNQVASTVKPLGAMDWAGTTMNAEPGGFANPIPFSASDTKMTVRVWSPDAGVPVRLKVEDQAD
ncbi:MAG: hypothetical protein ACI9OJ_002156, partial [Myxococcota bacterium]